MVPRPLAMPAHITPSRAFTRHSTRQIGLGEQVKRWPKVAHGDMATRMWQATLKVRVTSRLEYDGRPWRQRTMKTTQDPPAALDERGLDRRS